MAKLEQTEEAESNVLKDRWGNERPWDGTKYPDDSPANTGHITKPSGQGGAMPKSRPDHQDMFPPNPEPSEHAKDWGERLQRQEQGEDVDMTTAHVAADKKAPKTATKPGDTK